MTPTSVEVVLPTSVPWLTDKAAKALLSILLEHVDRERPETEPPVTCDQKAT